MDDWIVLDWIGIADSTRAACPRLAGGICALRCERDEDCQGKHKFLMHKQ